jgi:putative spermidine/putrescine transport system permease protein
MLPSLFGGRLRGNLGPLAAVAPAALFLLLVFVVPITMILALSFSGPGLGAQYYVRIVTAPVYLRVLSNTFQIALGVTLIALVLAYPLAYLLSTLGHRLSMALLGFVVLPWFTSLLVRSFAWMVLLGQTGIINHSLIALGFIKQPLPFLYSAVGVYVGMVHILLPYMVLALYSVMRGIDRSLLRAAQSAGAPPWRAFVHVYLPLSLPGVAAGSLLVFVMATGFYVTPALLGGPRQTMIAQLITSEINEAVNWEFGAALATVLLFVTLVGLGVFNRLLGVDRLLARDS